MDRSPRSLNTARYGKNYGYLPKLAFKRPVTSFLANFESITDRIFEVSVSNCIRKIREQNIETKSLKKGHPTVQLHAMVLE